MPLRVLKCLNKESVFIWWRYIFFSLWKELTLLQQRFNGCRPEIGLGMPWGSFTPKQYRVVAFPFPTPGVSEPTKPLPHEL